MDRWIHGPTQQLIWSESWWISVRTWRQDHHCEEVKYYSYCKTVISQEVGYDSNITVTYPRDDVDMDVVWWTGRRWLEAPVPVGTVRTNVSCDGDCRWERMPRVTGGSTDDDKDLVAPINRVLVDVERLEDTASSLRLQFNTKYNTMQNVNQQAKRLIITGILSASFGMLLVN